MFASPVFFPFISDFAVTIFYQYFVKVLKHEPALKQNSLMQTSHIITTRHMLFLFLPWLLEISITLFYLILTSYFLHKKANTFVRYLIQGSLLLTKTKNCIEPWNFFTIILNSFFKMKNVIIFFFLKDSLIQVQVNT